MALVLAGPRDMTVLLGAQRAPVDVEKPPVTIAASAVGRNALMQAYACIGIEATIGEALIAKAQEPRTPLRPLWDAAPALDVAKLLAAASIDQKVADMAAADAPVGLQAALLKAASTNSDPQSTMALIAAATANSAALAPPEPAPLPPSDPVPPLPEESIEASPPPPEEPSVNVESTPTSVLGSNFSFSFSTAKTQSPLFQIEADTASSENISRKDSGQMETLQALLQANKAASDATSAARPMQRSKLAPEGDPFESELQFGTAVKAAEIDGNAKIYFGGIPRGTAEGLILVESKKFGSVTSVYYEQDAGDLLEGGWALVTFVAADEALAAVKRLRQRVSLFGAAHAVEVRLGTPEDDERVERSKEAHAQAQVAAPDGVPMNSEVSGQRSRSRDGDAKDTKKKKKKRSRSRKRRRDRGRRRRRSSSSSSSGSSSDSGPKKRPAPTPVPAGKHKITGGSGGFDAVPSAANGLGAVMPSQLIAEEPTGGRQVGVRGSWAEFATSAGRNYYVNVVTGEKTWAKPADYSTQSSVRAGQVSANGIPLHHSNLFVGSIPYGCSEIMFRQMFAPFGHIVSMKVVPEKRHGFVKFSSVPEAQSAVDTMDGVVINGTPLSVKYASMGCH